MVLLLLALGAAPPASLTGVQKALVAPLAGLGREAERHGQAGRHEEACALFARILAAEEGVYGPLHAETLGSLAGLAGWREVKGDWDEALRLRMRAAEVARRLYGPEDYRAVDAGWAVRGCRLLARVGPARARRHFAAVKAYQVAMGHHAAGRYKEAEAVLRKALKDTEEAIGAESPFHATCLGDLGLLRKMAADHAGARALLGRALEARERMLGPRHPSVSVTLGTLALLLYDTGEARAALPLAERALAIRRDADGRGHPDYAICLNNVALLRHELGDPQAAYPLYKEVAGIQAATVGARSLGYATTLYNLGLVERDTGRFDDAAASLRRAREIVPAGHPLRVHVLRSLAIAVSEGGEPTKAVPLAREAIALAEKAHGRTHPAYATCLNDMAAIQLSMGDFLHAGALYEQTVALRRKSLGVKHPEYAAALNNLGNLLYVCGDLDNAVGACGQAVRIAEAVRGRSHPDTALYRHNLALAVQARGDPRAAIAMFEEAAAVQKAALGADSAAYAITLFNLASARQDLGDHAGAMALLGGAARAHAAVAGPYSRVRASFLRGMALSSLALRNTGAAAVYAEEALAAARARLERNAWGMSERQQLTAVAALSLHLGLRLTLPEESAEVCHGHVLAWKGSVLARQAQRRLFARLRADPLHRFKAMQLLDVTRRLAASHGRGADGPDGSFTLSILKERLEEQLGAASAEFRSARRRVGSAGLAAALPEGVALVDYFSVARSTSNARGEERLTAWVVRRGRPTARVEMGRSAPIGAAAAAWRAAVEAGKEGAVLRRMAWAPLEGHLGGATTVLVSPDGPLAGVPFAALPGRRSGGYLAEDVAVAVVTSPHALPELLAPARGADKPGLLTVGGPDFDAALPGRPRGTRGVAWKPLPGAEDEARAVAELFRGREARGPARPLSGGGATKDAARRLIGRSSFVHLATHGFFAEAGTAGGGGDGLGVRADEAAFIRRLHPGLLSGLVFAGANRPTEEDDGLLTALEVAEMDLSTLELAVLSACQTGLGKEAAGEGMLGLQRAFGVAGCRSVVSSLWSVDDAATAVLMERFYHHLWQKKLPRLEALRQAQMEVMRHPEWVEDRAKRLAGTPGLRGLGKASEVIASGKAVRRSPPAWWAAWQLSGDWR